MHRYFETIEKNPCTKGEITEHDILFEGLTGLQESLIVDHISRLYSRLPVQKKSSGVIRETAGRIKKSLTCEKK